MQEGKEVCQRGWEQAATCQEAVMRTDSEIWEMPDQHQPNAAGCIPQKREERTGF